MVHGGLGARGQQPLLLGELAWGEKKSAGGLRGFSGGDNHCFLMAGQTGIRVQPHETQDTHIKPYSNLHSSNHPFPFLPLKRPTCADT